MKANPPNTTPTTLREILGEDDFKYTDKPHKIQEQLKALLPPKSTKSEWRKKYNIKSDEMWDDGFDHAIELIEKAIEEWAK